MKRPLPRFSKNRSASPGRPAGPAMIRGPLRQTSVRWARTTVVPRRLHVACDVQIQVAVGIGVEESAAGAPAPGRHACPAGDLVEGAVALVAEQQVLPPVGDVHVEMAVAIHVPGADAVAPGGGVHARARRDVFELPAAEVAIERVAVRDALARRCEFSRGDQIDVEAAVAVVVEQRDAAAARFQDVVLGGPATVGSRRQRARLLRTGWTTARWIGRRLATERTVQAPWPRRGPRPPAPSVCSGCSCPAGSGRGQWRLRAGRVRVRAAPGWARGPSSIGRRVEPRRRVPVPLFAAQPGGSVRTAVLPQGTRVAGWRRATHVACRRVGCRTAQRG